MKPLAIDLCCGLGGWTEGLLSEGWHARGYDIEAHEYGEERYPGELVLQSVLDLNGADCADADLIVASPPCTEYSYMAMPWSRAKQIARALRDDGDFPDGYKGSRTIADLNAIFNACFRIQREASEAAGRHIPMVLENVKGAQPWVGRAQWAFGSYFLWGDIPALMPIQKYHQRLKVPAGAHVRDGAPHTARLTNPAEGRKNAGDSWFAIGSPGQRETGRNPVHALEAEGVKSDASRGGWFGDGNAHGHGRQHAHGSKARKAASAKIAKIPMALSSHIARVYLPARREAA